MRVLPFPSSESNKDGPGRLDGQDPSGTGGREGHPRAVDT